MTRKIIAMLLALIMLLSLAACDPAEPNPSNDPQPSQSDPAATDPEPSQSDPAPTDPTPTESQPTGSEGQEVYLGMTDVYLDSLPKVTADVFQKHMEVDWNFGWEGNATLEHNATKADFAGTASAEQVIWRLGLQGAEGAVLTDNAGWGVQLWTKGEGNIAYMYNKLDIPADMTQFRIWGVSNTNYDWSGSGAIRAVALYKNENGEYVKHVFTPVADTFIGNQTTKFNEEKGTVEFANGIWSIPDVLDNCMIIYDMADLAGKEDVVIVIESVGLGLILGDEYTEAAEGVPAGEVMPECVIIKRVMFLAA